MEPEWSQTPPEGADKEAVTVHGVEGSTDSLNEAVKDQHNAEELRGHIAALIFSLTKYGPRTLMTLRQMVPECTLPDGTHSYALKKRRKRMRAYGWWSKKLKGCFVISHFTFKSTEEMDEPDKTKVRANWTKFENGETQK